MTNSIEPLADTVAGAVKRLGVCRAKIYMEIASGRLIARKVGRRTIIERSAQEAWLAALPVMGGAAA